jgi:uroporphyrinogen III methyltransferase / synthase
MKKNRKNNGIVYLVGAGPGDPNLITLRGAQLLKEADAVVYDWLINPYLLEFAQCAEKFDVGKHTDGGKKTAFNQDSINQLLVELARKGKKVIRLKGGDPFVFGRGAEEASYLKKHGIPFEVVPGVSSGHAVPAYAGIPVTDRRWASSVTFVTAHEDPNKKESGNNWKAIAQLTGTLVLFMGVRTLTEATKLLMREGRKGSTPASVIEWGTFQRQRVIEGNLANIAQKAAEMKVMSPSIVVIGEVNRLRKELDWFEKKPLQGKCIAVTRASAQASSLKWLLENQGAEVLEVPAIQILPPHDWSPLDEAIGRMNDFNWMIFTSTNAVRFVFERVAHLGFDSRLFSTLKIAAIGEATQKALLEKGIKADLMPETYTSKALIEKLESENEIRGHHFLLARTDIAPVDLQTELMNKGGKVTQVIAYRTLPAMNPEKKKQLSAWIKKGKIDYITFTSSSTVTHFFEGLPAHLKKKLKSRLISIGPVTTQTLKSYGYVPYREAKRHTISGLMEALTPSPTLSR